jgi:predicted lipoprotein with Yx(FWY)xxD motif
MYRWLVPIAVMTLLVGCGESGEPADSSATQTRESPSPTRSSTPTSNDPQPAGTVITTADSEFGRMLFDATGQAIYLFDKESTSRPRCYGPCAAAWPPVLTEGVPSPSGQVDESLLGTTRRKDGSQQVTYAGHPLYFYAHEGKNQVLCHNVSEYGGLWLVVTPRGVPAP